jgi:hypothetical protein
MDTLRLEQTKLRVLAGAIHAAAGNKKGAKSAQRIRLVPREKPNVQQLSRAQRTFKPDENPEYGLLDPEQVARRAAELKEANGGR